MLSTTTAMPSNRYTIAMTGTSTSVMWLIRRTPPKITTPSRAISASPTATGNQSPSRSGNEALVVATMVLDCTALNTKPKVTVMMTAKIMPCQRRRSPYCM